MVSDLPTLHFAKTGEPYLRLVCNVNVAPSNWPAAQRVDAGLGAVHLSTTEDEHAFVYRLLRRLQTVYQSTRDLRDPMARWPSNASFGLWRLRWGRLRAPWACMATALRTWSYSTTEQPGHSDSPASRERIEVQEGLIGQRSFDKTRYPTTGRSRRPDEPDSTLPL